MAEERCFLSPCMSLFEVPASIMEHFCKIMDCRDDGLGWRGLAERLSTDWMDFRKVEKYGEQGQSPTRELLWSWAHKNKTVGDLQNVLKEMGNKRALHLFTGQAKDLFPTLNLKIIKEVTKDFHQDSLVGEGQFFKVYKAKINGLLCAIKVLKEKQQVEPEQWNLFISELTNLPKFHHPNIVQHIGFLSSNEETCLVYPYLMNGSLYERIQCSTKSSPLLWQNRYNILIEVATAIQYLHTVKPNVVICGSITSKNVLLDQHFHPKLSDFAMVHLRSCLVNHINTTKMDYTTFKSLGYLPEEYIRTGNLSSKTDVYSYGILVMEVLTGRESLIKGSKPKYLRDFVWDQLEKNGMESLFSLLDNKADIWPHCVARNLFNLSIDCTVSPARHRPTMEVVLKRVEDAIYTDTFTDFPKSLKSAPFVLCPSPRAFNYPEESDENQDFEFRKSQRTKLSENPCECSQSEVTFLGECRKGEHMIKTEQIISFQNNPTCSNCQIQIPEPLCGIRPTECSCFTGLDGTLSCEECMAQYLVSTPR